MSYIFGQPQDSIDPTLTWLSNAINIITGSNFSSISNLYNNNWSSNVAFNLVNNLTNMSNVLFPQAYFASNVASFSSNLAVTTSNYIYPYDTYLSNLAVTTSNYVYPSITYLSNSAVTNSNYVYSNIIYLSNAGNFASNLAVTTSNYVYSNITYLSNVGNTGSNWNFGSNLAVTTSNYVYPSIAYLSNATSTQNGWALSVGSNTTSTIYNVAIAGQKKITADCGNNWGTSLVLKNSSSTSPDGAYFIQRGGGSYSNHLVIHTDSSYGASGFSLVTNNFTNRFFMRAVDGFIGINNLNPSCILDVVGDINYSGVLKNNGVPVNFGGSGSGWAANGSAIYSLSNIGIGTNSPGAPFQCVSGTYSMAFQQGNILSLMNSAGSPGAILLGQSATSFNCATILYNYLGYASVNNYLGIGAYGTDNILNIAGNGRVGIACTPNYTLDVNGDLNVIGNFYKNSVPVNFGGSGSSVGWAANGSSIYSLSNIGIGTNSPAFMLDVNGSTRVGYQLTLGNSINSSQFKLTDIVGAAWQMTTANYQLAFQNDNGGTFQTIMYLDNGGNLRLFGTINANAYQLNGVPVNFGGLGSSIGWAANGSAIYTMSNIGIGTSSPAYQLDVTGSIRATSTIFTPNRIAITNDDPGDMISKSYTTGVDRYGMGQYAGGTTRLFCTQNSYGSIRFCAPTNNVTTGGGAFTDFMSILSTGLVGIGISTPQYKFHVVGDINYTGNLYNNGTVVSFMGSKFPTNVWIQSVDNVNRLSFGGNGTTYFGMGQTYGWVFQNNSTTNVVIIDYLGNVSLTSVSATGNISGSTISATTISASGNISASAISATSIYSSGSIITSASLSANNLSSSWLTSNFIALQKTDGLSASSGIYFATGTSSYNQLQISAANDGFTFWTANSGQNILYSRANISNGGSYNQISDRNLKNLVSYLNPSSSLDIINNLKPCFFTFKNDESSTVQSGFFAQDVQEHIPEIVSNIGDSLGMNYVGLNSYIVAAIQEISSKYDDLSLKYTELSAKYDELKNA